MSDSKVVIITGSSSGIGRGTALLFASKGFRVVVHGSSSSEKVNSVVDECNKKASSDECKSIGVVADLQDPDNGLLIARKAIEHFGRIDTVICNAGIYDETDFRSNTCFEDYKRVMNVNLNSHIRLLQEAIPYLLKSSNSSIIIISDVTVERPVFNHFGYTMTRAALRSLAACLAVELAPNVRSISVTLGEINTPQYEKLGVSADDLAKYALLDRCGSIDEIAHSLWHLSQEATYITGTNICIDGGYTIKSNAEC